MLDWKNTTDVACIHGNEMTAGSYSYILTRGTWQEILKGNYGTLTKHLITMLWA